MTIIHKARSNNEFGQRAEGLKELRQVIEDLEQRRPLIGRILTREKYYSGRIDELRFGRDGYLVFSITDCDPNGKSSESAKTYKRKVRLEDLVDIQV
ncbi:MAG: hypothetical protein FJZ07_02215 [Candidatus Nealsonbacteria bacterium]|nr:hypothetical protein [Candidatus Nealsonbacteria bacterium]